VDVREAPALELIEGLLQAGAMVKAFDPAAMDQVAALFSKVEMCKDAYAVAEGSDAVVLMTEWNQFRNLDLARIRKALRSWLSVGVVSLLGAAAAAYAQPPAAPYLSAGPVPGMARISRVAK